MDKNSKSLQQTRTKHLPIGIFDSGLGGLTVLSELIKALPFENVTYFGDTARLPYGNKGHDTIMRFSKENADFLIELGIKALVIACNTSSAVALDTLQRSLPVPVIGVIDPGVAAAVAHTSSGHIGVLGTRGTVASGAYQRAICAASPHVVVHAIACPLFVPLVEENFVGHAAADLIIRDYLGPLQYTAVDTLILGCTHYPLLREQIQMTIGTDVTIIDSAKACAAALQLVLNDLDLLREPAPPRYSFHVSDDPVGFQCMGQAILGDLLQDVQLMSELCGKAYSC